MGQIKTGGSGKEAPKTGDPPKAFGVRSYLADFYQQPSAAELEGQGWYLVPGQRRPGRGLLACRAASLLGLILLLSGSAALVIAYSWPREPLERQLLRVELSRDEAGGVWVPRESLPELLHDPTRDWKLIGLGVFAAGGLLLSLSMLLPTLALCCAGHPMAAQLLPEPGGEPPIRIFPRETIEERESPRSPTEKKVPVMEAIAKVQPDKEEAGIKRRVSEDELLMAEGEPAVSAAN